MHAENELFSQRIDHYGRWRAGFAGELQGFSAWLQGQGLRDAVLTQRLERLLQRLGEEKITVAFVAEYSRGKSEMINAMLFSGYGCRIMPASAGRTTMCPTELTWDPSRRPGVRLLPIDTCKQVSSLDDWRLMPSAWKDLGLDTNSAASVAQAVQSVTETLHVDVDEAQRLGFWQPGSGAGNPPLNAAGQVEVPRWRHAIVNFPHPLLRQGLVILDTPGLNAIGAEPELTVSMLPQAHAVVFLLGADTGVTNSDRQIWQEYLSELDPFSERTLVALNKIDTLWDGLTSSQAQAGEIQRQRADVARMLDLQLGQVLAVSAQKALVARINADKTLLVASGIEELERLLVDVVLEQRHAFLAQTLLRDLDDIGQQLRQQLHMRLRNLTEQIDELKGLQGRSGSVRRSIRMRIASERKEFDASVSRILGLRSVQNRLLNDAFRKLSGKTIRLELAELSAALRDRMVSFGFQKRFMQSFANLRQALSASQAIADEMHRHLVDSYGHLNMEYGFSLQMPGQLSLHQFELDLDRIARSNQHHFSLGNALRLSSGEFSTRLITAVSSRLRAVFEAAANEFELWSKTATAQLDVQLRERRHNFIRRSAMIERLDRADTGLAERLQELQTELAALGTLEGSVQMRCDALEASLHSVARELALEPGGRIAAAAVP